METSEFFSIDQREPANMSSQLSIQTDSLENEAFWTINDLPVDHLLMQLFEGCEALASSTSDD